MSLRWAGMRSRATLPYSMSISVLVLPVGSTSTSGSASTSSRGKRCSDGARSAAPTGTRGAPPRQRDGVSKADRFRRARTPTQGAVKDTLSPPPQGPPRRATEAEQQPSPRAVRSAPPSGRRRGADRGALSSWRTVQRPRPRASRSCSS